ncbi:hypothetical protein HPB52_014919 [Rhipicephalus sanguineus]|uniref:Uncharacterized protein n=1 Tax=Rhipicephalus sanguineus TaxID=34632 RepID=A0A9D4SP94_RHISA|nr:hypothetical protein HPB52_014919 [Rhipicephalus sanguineus]
MSTLILAARVVVIGGRMRVTPHLRNLSQMGYFMCEHHDEDRILEILHAEYIVIKHVKNALHAISVGPKDGKGCDSRKSMTAVNKHCRKQSERRAGIRALSAYCESPPKSVSTATTQMEQQAWSHECKGRNSSFDGNVNAMENNLAQVNDLDHVPLFELLPISEEDTSVVSLDESN